MSIEIRNLNKRFGKTVVCNNLNLDIPSGELVALLAERRLAVVGCEKRRCTRRWRRPTRAC